MNFLPLLFGLIALILYGATALLLLHAKRLRSHCIPCMGTILRLEEELPIRVPSKSHHRRLVPILTYMVDGRVYETRANYYATGMRVGMQLKLLCDREDPSKAVTSGGGRVACAITGGLAVFFTLMAAVLAAALP